jgi:hypothetical protein
MHFCIAALQHYVSRQRSDKCYLSVVQMGWSHPGRGDWGNREPHSTGTKVMSIQINRILDAVASFAIVVLGLGLAGATAVVGA